MGFSNTIGRKLKALGRRWFWGRNTKELFRRLKTDIEQVQHLKSRYEVFQIPKRSGGQREICAPQTGLKHIQRQINRSILSRLKSHPATHGFENNRSIVTNALPHMQKPVVLRMDIKDFFTSTSDKRIYRYFRCIGWNRKASRLLAELCTYKGNLPQGAPTSPRLSNLVNYLMDVRLAALGKAFGATYTRYADDMTFSFKEENRLHTSIVIRSTKKIVNDYGYRLHQKRKLQIRRKHQCQKVTGLVVNEKIALPRQTRRWLRAVEHYHATGKPSTLTPQQLQGWRALKNMVDNQTKDAVV